MAKTLLRFLLLFALLLLGYASAHAQAPAGTATALVTDFDELAPDTLAAPPAPRYAQAAELTELKAQLQNLVQAYDQLVTRYNAQSAQLQQIIQQQAAATHGRSRAQHAAQVTASSY